MKGFIDLQQSIYRSYALVRYNSPNIRALTAEEKSALEIQVKVDEGSSKYEVNFQELFLKFIDLVGGEMEPIHTTTIVLGIGVMYFGSSSLKSYLEHRREVLSSELKNKEQIKLIESRNFADEQETERTKILSESLMRSRGLLTSRMRHTTRTQPC